mmetsp:Transcript_139780/g.447055  ORF Transcript_139780/g.447055 Transcript_139780/m.447055 type:complete len:91 (-) Transcript_139780:1090-1362(-)
MPRQRAAAAAAPVHAMGVLLRRAMVKSPQEADTYRGTKTSYFLNLPLWPTGDGARLGAMDSDDWPPNTGPVAPAAFGPPPGPKFPMLLKL